MTASWITVVQTRSPIRRHHSQRETLNGLGLKGIGRARVLPDTPATRGMIRKVSHLVRVYDRPLMGVVTPAMRKDLQVLRRFNRRVARTERSGFWRRYRDQIPNVTWRMDKMHIESTGPATFAMEGIIHSSLDNFDQDEVAAFALDYRQYTQRNDAISIASIGRIYARPWMQADPRAQFEQMRARFNRELDSATTLIFGDYHMSVRNLVDIVLYGGLAHSNPKKADIFENWEQSGIMGLVWAEFFSAMRSLMSTLILMRSLNEIVISVADPASSRLQTS